MWSTWWLRCLCCFKKVKVDELSRDDDESREFLPVRYAEPLVNREGPAESFFRSSVLSIYKRVDSAYQAASEWSLPRNTRVNLFTLSEEDMNEYEENNFFDDVVDEKF